MKETLQGIGIVILYILIGGLWLGGCIHSCKKHKDDPMWLQETPLAAYRGVEYFWHDDFEGVDWNKRLLSDLRSCVYFVNEGTAKSGNIYQVNEGIEEFAKKISSYPSDKKEYLQKGLITYYKYNFSSTTDLVNAMYVYYETGTLTIHYSQNSINYKDILKEKYQLDDIVDNVDSLLNLMADDLNKKYDGKPLSKEASEKAKEDFKQAIGITNSNLKVKLKKIYKDIFAEELKEQL